MRLNSNDGEWESFDSIKLKVRRLSRTEKLDVTMALQARQNGDAAALMYRTITDWQGVTDEHDKPVAFGQVALDNLFGQQTELANQVEDFLLALNGLKEGADEPPLAAGSERGSTSNSTAGS